MLGYKTPDDDLLLRDNEDVRSLLFIAQGSGMRTTGDLARFVKAIAKGSRDSDLKRVHRLATKHGLKPYAVGWQVATIPLLVDCRAEIDKSVLSPHLRKAIFKVAASKS